MRTPITHPLNVSYLVVGLAFLGISGSWALRTAGVVSNHQVGWLLPVVLVAAGAVGLVAFAAKGVSRRRQGQGAGSAEAYPQTDTALDDAFYVPDHSDLVERIEGAAAQRQRDDRTDTRTTPRTPDTDTDTGDTPDRGDLR
jgi:hypothetical protein